MSKFEHSTLANISVKSKVQWVHFTLAFFIFILAIIGMQDLASQCGFQNWSNTNPIIMLERVPHCTKGDLITYFGTEVVSQITFTFDQTRLEHIRAQYKHFQMAVDYCKTHPGVKLYTLCWGASDKDAQVYYQDQLQFLSQAYQLEKNRAKKSPLGIVLVTFIDIQTAMKVYHSFLSRGWFRKFKPQNPCKLLKPEQWKVTYAPPLEEIYWHSLANTRSGFLRRLIANAILFIFVLLVTTPKHATHHMDELLEPFLGSIAQSFFKYLSSFYSFLFTLLFPIMVGYIDSWFGCNYTRSQEATSVMIKTYIYLVLSVIIFPTFGITYLTQVLQIMSDPDTSKAEDLWKCFFLPDSGAVVINYMIFVALTGNPFELLRIPKFLVYFYRRFLRAKSKAECKAIAATLKTEFPIGEAYAQYLLMITMSIMFSFTCPLITPFGLLYAIVKYFVDRHNLFYEYKYCKVDDSVHNTATVLLVVSTILQLFLLTIYSIVYKDWLPRQFFIMGLWTVATGITVFFFKSRH